MTFGEQAGLEPCYRHPGQLTGVRCQRCGRPICSTCQIPAAVGMQCPGCVRQGRANVRSDSKTKTFVKRNKSLVTWVIIGLCVVMWGLQWVVPNFTQMLGFIPIPEILSAQPWRFVTSIFLHSTGWPLHILFNMYTLWIFGQVLEPMLGRLRYAVLFLLAGLGGSVAVYMLDFGQLALTIGASGAIFGMLGALIVILRKRAMQYGQLILLAAINFAMMFFVSGISWQAHLGGLITGAVVGGIMERFRDRKQIQIAALVAVAVLLIVLVFVREALPF